MRFLVSLFLLFGTVFGLGACSCLDQSKKFFICAENSDLKLVDALVKNSKSQKLQKITCKNWDSPKILSALETGQLDAYIGSLDQAGSLKNSILIAKDGLVIVSNKSNKQASLTMVQLKEIFARQKTNWSSISGNPDESPIVVIDQSENSSSKIYLYQQLFANNQMKFSAKVKVENSAEIKNALAKFPNAISYINFSEYSDSLKAFQIDSIPATKENVQKGYFPLFRPVKIYFNKTTLKTSSKSQDFNELLNLILGNKGQQLIEDLSYIPLDQAELNNIKTNNRAILIGVGVPLDGTYTDLSKSIINAVKLAAEQLNEAGGIDSRDIEIITCNDESRVDQGLVCAQKFIDAGVTAVIGHLNSQVSIETSKLYVEHQIPMITAASTHPWFTERPGARGFVFRTVGRDDKQAELLAKSISNLAIPHPAKVAIFNNSTVYGATLSSLIEAQIIGIAKDKVTAIKALQQGKNQYHNEVEALDAQVLVFVGEATDAAQLVKELALTNHKNIVFIGAEGIFSQRYIQEAGLRAEGTYVTGTILELGSKQLEDFENLYLEKFKTKPTAFALNAFDAMMILGQALKNSQTENIPLIDSIKKTNYSGITGQIMFNSIGDPIQPRMCLYQVKNAKFIKLN
ncbi:MAG: ABC transporter substrate-binding protein [Candidatus Caenarcaniphilales bacterium]|nr:ABC transporter substrate-binding protein [Candidatus Caenarcaniphilales bacterium]